VVLAAEPKTPYGRNPKATLEFAMIAPQILFGPASATSESYTGLPVITNRH
jgi:hypothetical protein